MLIKFAKCILTLGIAVISGSIAMAQTYSVDWGVYLGAPGCEGYESRVDSKNNDSDWWYMIKIFTLQFRNPSGQPQSCHTTSTCNDNGYDCVMDYGSMVIEVGPGQCELVGSQYDDQPNCFVACQDCDGDPDWTQCECDGANLETCPDPTFCTVVHTTRQAKIIGRAHKDDYPIWTVESPHVDLGALDRISRNEECPGGGGDDTLCQ